MTYRDFFMYTLALAQAITEDDGVGHHFDSYMDQHIVPESSSFLEYLQEMTSAIREERDFDRDKLTDIVVNITDIPRSIN